MDLPDRLPAVTVVLPARNERGTIGAAVCSLLSQNYPGKFDIIVVDDGSSDGTAEAARAAAAECAGSGKPPGKLAVLAGKPLPAGWAGKPWAVQQGLDTAAARAVKSEYVLLTDADVTHAPHVLSALVGRAVAGNLVLVSVMATLRCSSLAERFAIPAFVYFFRMLYPFPWVADEARRTAAAAGGCVLLRARDLEDAGGFHRIADALIDDCALSRLMKPRGRIWLGLSHDVRSVRPYRHLGAIGKMVTRSAYTELRHSPLRLLGAMAAMAMTFLAPPLLLLFASGPRGLCRHARLRADGRLVRPDAALLWSRPLVGTSFCRSWRLST